MNFSIIYEYISKIIHSLGSNKLTNVVQSVCDKENTPASIIIKHGIFMWYNKSLQIDNIYDKIESDGFSKTAKRIMEHRIVNHCQTHSMGFKEHEQIELRSKIPKQTFAKENSQQVTICIMHTLRDTTHSRDVVIRYGKGASFTKLKGHRLHFFSRIYSQKMNVYALETNDTYGTKN